MAYIVAFISLILIVHSCDNSENRSSKEQDNADSISQFQQNKKDTIPTVPPPKQRLAPGQVRVEAMVVTISTDQPDSTRNLRLRIRNILGYGSSTPPIPTGDTLDISVKEEGDSFEEGTTMQVRLQHNVSLKDKDSGSVWSLVDVEN